MPLFEDIKVFSGNAHPILTKNICSYLDIHPAKSEVFKFSNDETFVDVPLIKIAYGRSGDKGNKSNIGIIARDEKFYPVICNFLTEEIVKKNFQKFLLLIHIMIIFFTLMIFNVYLSVFSTPFTI